MSLNPTITFVSAFFNVENQAIESDYIQKCVETFCGFASNGFAILLYLDDAFASLGQIIRQKCPNVQIRNVGTLENTWTYGTVTDAMNLQTSDEYKDLRDFLILMNSKIEFVTCAVHENPFKTMHFAWFDFCIHQYIQRPSETYRRLFVYGHSDLKPCMAFPGISNTDQIYGDFFIGDKVSLLNANQMYRTFLTDYLQTFTQLQPDTKIWLYIRSITEWKCTIWRSQKDDSLVAIPSRSLEVDASLTTIPPREECCRLAIDSLLHQVRNVYLNISNHYKRFGDFQEFPFLHTEPYASRVIICCGEDYGSMTKYIGGLNQIPASTWIFFCDDDQEYHATLLERMKERVVEFGVYQNRYEYVRYGSGGIIHGYVGNMVHRSLLQNALEFPKPECAFSIDDQWMSVYHWMQNNPVYATGIEEYTDLFKTLNNGYEMVGAESLANLGNRDAKIKELEAFFGIVFEFGGGLRKLL